MFCIDLEASQSTSRSNFPKEINENHRKIDEISLKFENLELEGYSLFQNLRAVLYHKNPTS